MPRLRTQQQWSKLGLFRYMVSETILAIAEPATPPNT